jgi:putative hydrolase of the HAD superfamily
MQETGSVPALAISLDFWDTLYDGAALPERVSLRQTALRRLFHDVGCAIDDAALVELYAASGAEAERWWRDEHRGYTAEERIRWMLARTDVERPHDCPHVARTVAAVDDALLAFPPSLLPGAREALLELAPRVMLAITSDTGFASGRAQDRLLERDGIAHLFATRTYSADVGHAKPRREPFETTLRALALPAGRVLHLGDDERTDVRGALAAGMRAARMDIVQTRGPSAGEFVARSWEEALDRLIALV